MIYRILLLVMLLITGCETSPPQNDCLENAKDPMAISQCNQQSLEQPIPRDREAEIDIANMKDQLGIRERRENCQALGTEDLHVKMNCEYSHSIQLEIKCLQKIAENDYPMALRGKNIDWEIGNQKGTTTTNQEGRFVISIERKNSENLKNKTFTFSFKGKKHQKKASHLNKTIMLERKDC